MKVLLTGGAGFIGSHVAEAYLEAGHDVVVVDDLSSGSRANVPGRAGFYLMSITAAELVRVFELEKPDVVNHHAAQISVTASARDPSLDARVNALGTLNVLECCRASGVGKLIFVSSGGAVYGEASLERVPEDYPPRPLSPYAIHKLAGEHYVRFYNRQHGLAFTILRYSNVYGPRQDPAGEAGVVSIFVRSLLAGETPTLNAFPEDPDGMSRDYVFVGDVARANLLALDRGSGEAVNIGSGRPVKTRELLAALCRILGRELAFVPAGPRPGDLRYSCLDNRKALALLGWKPEYGLEKGLEETVAYLTRRKAPAHA
jgi:UDP-glucose 4-epimerase